jgi:hypothetical protein
VVNATDAAKYLDIDLWQPKIKPSSPARNVTCVLPNYPQDQWVKIKPLFCNIMRIFDLNGIHYCTLRESDLVLELADDEQKNQTLLSFGVEINFKDEVGVNTLDLNDVLQGPLLKKQVYQDVRKMCL